MDAFIPSDIIDLLPYIASTAFSAGLAVIAILNDGKRRTVRWFAVIMALEAAWAASFILEVFSARMGAKLLWDAFHWPVMLAVDSAIVMFAFTYVTPSRKSPSPPVIVLLAAPVAFTAVAAALAVAGMTGPLYERVGRTVMPFAELAARPSPFVYGVILYGYVLFAAACVLLARNAFAKGADRSRGAGFLLAGLAIQLAASIVDMLFRASPGSLWSPPLWTAIRNVLLAYGLFNDRLVASLSKDRKSVV